MCGIAGIFDLTGSVDPKSLLEEILEGMKARGPDDAGSLCTSSWAIGMRRLSIVDLEKGAQPQANETDEIFVLHNGEIYNHQDLRGQLQERGHRFTTRSDTEVLVHGYEEWGIEGLLSRIEGMFALAIVDRKENQLHLARDRFGEKPLYLRSKPGELSFSSDLKTLVQALGLRTEIDPLSLRRYLALHYIPGNRSIIKGVERLLPGERAVADLADLKLRKHRYYEGIPKNGEDFDPEHLRSLLEKAISSRLMGDVPVGVFLSGGLDSSLVTALAAQHSSQLKTFSIGFDSASHDESAHASKIANTCGVSHHLIKFGEQDFRELLPIVAQSLDEPLGDPAALPTFRLCQKAKESVKVILSGEGADEIFAGYSYYLPFVKKGGWFKRVFGKCSHDPISRLLDPISLRTPSGFPLLCGKEEWESLAEISPDGEADAWEEDYLATIGSFEDPLRKATLSDTLTWLPDNLLIKLDRITMSNSLEGRSPFLMQSLVEYGHALPSSSKIKGDEVKHALRIASSKWVPAENLKRNKQGFVLPMAPWLQNYVEDFGGAAEYVRQRKCDCLDENRLIQLLQARLQTPVGNERILFSLILFLEWMHHVSE